MDEIPSLADVEDAAPQTLLSSNRRKSLVEIEAYLTSLTPSFCSYESQTSSDHVIGSEAHFILLDSTPTTMKHELESKIEDTDRAFPLHLYPQSGDGTNQQETNSSSHSFSNYPKDKCLSDDLSSCYAPSDPSLFSTNVRDSRSSTTSTVYSFDDGFSLSSTSTQPLQGHICTSPCSSSCTLLTMFNMRERERERHLASSDNEFEGDIWCNIPLSTFSNSHSLGRYLSSVTENMSHLHTTTTSESDCWQQMPYDTMSEGKVKCEDQKITAMDPSYLDERLSGCWKNELCMEDRHDSIKEQETETPVVFFNDSVGNSTVQELFSPTASLVILPENLESSYSLIPSRRTSRQTYPHCSTYKHSYRSEPQRERVHRCPVQDCLKAYTKSSHLRAHMKMHTGEKPHGCEFCGRRYVRKDELKRHQIQHTGEKRYSCFVCGKKFGRSDHAKKHVEIKHPSQLLELENRRAGGRIRWDSQ